MTFSCVVPKRKPSQKPPLPCPPSSRLPLPPTRPCSHPSVWVSTPWRNRLCALVELLSLQNNENKWPRSTMSFDMPPPCPCWQFPTTHCQASLLMHNFSFSFKIPCWMPICCWTASPMMMMMMMTTKKKKHNFKNKYTQETHMQCLHFSFAHALHKRYKNFSAARGRRTLPWILSLHALHDAHTVHKRITSLLSVKSILTISTRIAIKLLSLLNSIIRIPYVFLKNM